MQLPIAYTLDPTPETKIPNRGNVKRFRGGLVFKAHRLLYHSTLGLRVIKKRRKNVKAEAPA